MRKIVVVLSLLIVVALSTNVMAAANGTANIINITAMSKKEASKLISSAQKKNTSSIFVNYGQYDENTDVSWDPQNPKYTKQDFVNCLKEARISDIDEHLKLVLLKSKKMLTYQKGFNKFFVKHASQWYDICTKYHIDPVFMVSIACLNSKFGTSKKAVNDGNLFRIKYPKNIFKTANPEKRAMKLLEYALKNDYWGWNKENQKTLFWLSIEVDGIVWWHTYTLANSSFVKVNKPTITSVLAGKVYKYKK